jgi:DNA polymerase zeta
LIEAFARSHAVRVGIDLYLVTPNEVMFVTKEVREGVLPRLLREILETRIVVKAAMKLAKNDKVHSQCIPFLVTHACTVLTRNMRLAFDPREQALYKKLNAQQFGLKMIANVTYGYTSANFSGRMPCVEVRVAPSACTRVECTHRHARAQSFVFVCGVRLRIR